jgi:hypothetical protein
MALGIAGLILLAVAGAVVVAILMAVAFWRGLGRKAASAGYASTAEYLRAAPQTDEEKRDAVDLTLKGVVICVLGLLFPPLLLFGLFPLFYGARKLAFASMGLGLVDDADQPSA